MTAEVVGRPPLPTRLLEAPPRYRVSAEQRAVAERARRFLHEVILPLEGTVAESDPPPPDVERHLAEQAKTYGLWGIATPKEHGGLALGELGYVLVHEQIAQGTIGDIRHDRGVGGDPWPTLFLADAEQQRKYLTPVLRGEHGMFFGLTEPGGGSDAAGIQTTAVPDGGGWRINGTKKWIGRGGDQPFGVVFAVTDPERRAKGGMTAFFVDRGTDGFTHVRDIMTMGAARTAELRFDDCWVPTENVLGEVGRAFEYAQLALSRTRVRQAVLNLGAAQRAFDLLMRWMPERHTFGRALADREPLRWRVARAAADLQAARHLIYRVAWQIDQGGDPRWEVPTMKTHAAQMACRVIDLAIQLHGAIGVSKELPLERMYRDVRAFRISEGADEVQRMLVARELLGRES